MVEKMTAVWLIILTVMVCAAVPGVLIWLTTESNSTAKMIAASPVAGIGFSGLQSWLPF